MGEPVGENGKENSRSYKNDHIFAAIGNLDCCLSATEWPIINQAGNWVEVEWLFMPLRRRDGLQAIMPDPCRG